MSSGQPSVANGQSADENHVSRTSVSRSSGAPPPAACAECGGTTLERETDVLDTWFSSALWPFATLGWPERTPELERYYPGDVNVTAREIIRLWENRMIFCGLFLLGEVPFTDVIITSTVLAVDGRRMSKSLGTGIDPLEAVGRHGADATRYGLLVLRNTYEFVTSEPVADFSGTPAVIAGD